MNPTVYEAPHNLEASMMFVCTKGLEISVPFTATLLFFAAMPPCDLLYQPTVCSDHAFWALSHSQHCLSSPDLNTL